MLSNGIGKSIDDLKWNYTVDQIYLLYERCIRRSMEDNRTQAIILAHAMSYTSPHKDKSGIHKSEKLWRKFLDTFDWTKQREKGKVKKKSELVKAFKGARLPVR